MKSQGTQTTVSKIPTMSCHTPDDQMVVNLTDLVQNANTMRRNRPYREDILGAHWFAWLDGPRQHPVEYYRNATPVNLIRYRKAWHPVSVPHNDPVADQNLVTVYCHSNSVKVGQVLTAYRVTSNPHAHTQSCREPDHEHAK